MTRSVHRVVVLVVLTSLSWPAPASVAVAADQAQPCAVTGSLGQLPGLSEASGLALSRRIPGRLWTHNDSGQPVLFALDSRGAVAGQVRVNGAKVEDWEAITVGSCGSDSCIYIGDIGDNDAKRRRITVYRVPEPDTAARSISVNGVFHGTYPDGPHDAEALLFAGGRLHIVTKGETGPVALYRFPIELQAGTAMKLERVGQTTLKRDEASRITDGAVSADERWVALRSRSQLMFYQSSEALNGQWRPVSTVDLVGLKEPQGEGVTFGADGSVLLAGEGGGKGRPGTFARLACSLPRS